MRTNATHTVIALALLLSACHLPGPTGPSDLAVQADLKALAAKSCVRAFNEKEALGELTLEFLAFERQGVSIENNVARVKGITVLWVAGQANKSLMLGSCDYKNPDGFDNWLRAAGIDSYTFNEFSPEKPLRFAVTLLYRQYDSGWSLEGIE